MANLDAISLPSSIGSDLEDLEDESGLTADLALAPVGQVAFMEIFSNPRVGPHCQNLGLRTGPPIDVETGWDLLDEGTQHRLIQLITWLSPLVIMLSPPCTVFSQVQATMTHRRADLSKWAKQYEDGKKLFLFALQLFAIQMRAGRKAVLEHPWLATSWNLDATKALLSNQTVKVQVFDQCLVGLRTPVSNLPARKRTKLMTNWGLPACFSERCTPATCNHFPESHAWLQGSEGGVGLTRAAQRYPEQMCRNLATSVHFYCTQEQESDIDMLSLPGDASDHEL